MTHEEAIKPLDSAIWEMHEVFDGLRDEDVWVRPHPRLLSVGELAAHVANGEAASFFKEFESPLVTEKVGYYLSSVDEPFALDMSAEALYAEVKRVHEDCMATFLELKPDLHEKNPFREEWTWSYVLEYMAFHIAYHTGQMYSLRHLMGHETANN